MKNIAIVSGGFSNEIVIALKSAATIINNIDRSKFTPYLIIITEKEWYLDGYKNKLKIDKNDFSFIVDGNKVKIDAVFNIIHGTPGEDGKLQGYLDMLSIPHTSCDVLSSSLTFNKHFCKEFLRNFGVKSAEALIFFKKDVFPIDAIITKLGLPCFVKPNGAGSSFGISKVYEKKELDTAMTKAFDENNQIIIEEFIEGIEVTCAVYKSENSLITLPLTEIVSSNDFFDYEAKYKGLSDEITPARISNELRDKCFTISKNIYHLLNCSGIIRIDYLIKNNVYYLIEVNTVPGMSAESIVPKMVKEAGLDFKDLINTLLEECIK